MKKLALHWKILIGMALGIIVGLIAVSAGGQNFVIEYVKPFGTIFINLLKLIAIPLIIASLIKGISDLKDISKLSKMGGRTIGIYLLTTVFAVTVGLVLVNLINPGKSISEETRNTLLEQYAGDAVAKIEMANSTADRPALQPLIDLVPENIFSALTDNGNMLQVIFFVIFFAIAMILVDPKISNPVKGFIDGFNEIILKMIDLIMLAAPLGVFALLAALIVEIPSWDLFKGLLWYSVTLLLALAFLVLIVYPFIAKTFTGFSYVNFFRGIGPAQLVAFSTSSSAATLPVTMERVNEHMGVDDEVTSFVLPIGATVNMDGTSAYQAVAAIFIAQVYGIDLTLMDQLTIVLTATLASIGAAAVPSAGIIMLVIVLESVGVPPAGIALIFAVDRPLDMCRTIVNVTGDATVALLVGKSLGKIGPPKEKKWDDNLDQVL